MLRSVLSTFRSSLKLFTLWDRPSPSKLVHAAPKTYSDPWLDGLYAMRISTQIPHLTMLVCPLWFCRTCSLSTRRHICSNWAVERVSGDGFESSGAPHMPNGGSLEAKEGMTRHGNSDESPSTDAPAQVTYAQGSAASASSFSRALSSNSYEGCPRARRMISRLA